MFEDKPIAVIGAAFLVTIVAVAYMLTNTPAPQTLGVDTTADQQQGEVVTPQEEFVSWCVTMPDEVATCYEPIQIDTGDTAYDSFEDLATREESLEFSATDYGEFGYFVDEINGVVGDVQNFWKLYYQGEGAQIGISDLQIHHGDQLEFRFEAIDNGF